MLQWIFEIDLQIGAEIIQQTLDAYPEVLRKKMKITLKDVYRKIHFRRGDNGK